MATEYINRKGQKYYLHQGTTKTGKPKYFFSMKSEGNIVKKIPDGFEIYENPNAQVFLRRTQPKIITDEEIATVDKGVKRFSSLQYYQIDVKKDASYVYTPNQNVAGLSERRQGVGRSAGRAGRVRERRTCQALHHVGHGNRSRETEQYQWPRDPF